MLSPGVQRKSYPRHRYALAAIVAVAFVIAAAWALVTPLFAEPDEQAHLDYVFAIARDALPPPRSASVARSDSDALLRYFEGALHYREARFDATYRFGRDYWSRARTRAIDAGAPSDRAAEPAAAIPLVSIAYPIGYYAAAAAVYDLARRFAQFGPLEATRAMRLLGCAFLIVTLVCSFGIFRRCRFGRTSALLATAAVALFPLTGWLSAMVQPDTMTAAAMSVAVLFVMRCRDRPDARLDYAVVAAALAALALTKVHYAIVAGAAVAPVLLSGVVRHPSRARLLKACSVFATVAIAVLVSLHTIRHATTPVAVLSGTLISSPLAWLGDLVAIYFYGAPHDTFWTSRDWAQTAYFPEPWLTFVRACISVAGALWFVLVMRTVVSSLRRIARIGKRKPRTAVWLCTRDAALWTYGVWTLGLIAADLSLPHHLGLLGRYWFAVFAPMLVVSSYAATGRPRPAKRERARRTISAIWLAYGCIVTPLAFAQMYEAAFGPRIPLASTDTYVNLERIYDSRGTTFHTSTIAVDRDARLCLRGNAIDSRYGLPARGVLLRIGGRDYPLSYATDPHARLNFYADDALRNIGFSGCIDMSELAPGTYSARLLIVARDATNLTWPQPMQIVALEREPKRSREGNSRRAR